MARKPKEPAKPTGPAFGYKKVDGEVIAKLFTDGVLEQGWVDSPAKAK